MNCSSNRRMNRGLSARRPRLPITLLLALSVTAFSLLSEATAASDITTNTVITASNSIVGNVNVRHASGPFPPIVVLHNGGTIDGTLSLFHASNLNIKAGGKIVGDTIVSGKVIGLSPKHQSIVDMEDGTVEGGVTAIDSSRVIIRGGTITGDVTASGSSRVIIRGGTIGDVYVRDCGTISLVGFATFDVNGDSVDDRKLQAVLDPAYTNSLHVRYALSGALADGEDVTGKYVYVQKTANCDLNALSFSNSTRPAHDPDTDDDGLRDGVETALGTNPNDSDTDKDGLTDGVEVAMGPGNGCLDPLNPDSDGDTLLDGDEVAAETNPCLADRKLTSMSPAILWIGLKNSDDQGTNFDVRVEVLKNGSPLASGEARCITGVTRNAAKAKEVSVSLGMMPNDTDATDASVASGDILSLRILTRIGTTPEDTKCPGHANAGGLRMYYDASNRTASFGANLTPDPLQEQDFFLHAGDGDNDILDNTAPTAATAIWQDSPGVKFAGGNLWKEIGTWSMIVP
ncbi:MAG TPA: hypothetical protein VI542_09870 [Candidatus Tectomicrobia bacterium]